MKSEKLMCGLRRDNKIGVGTTLELSYKTTNPKGFWIEGQGCANAESVALPW